ncbi:MAG: hypothetical protein IBV52_09565 [Candidatus Bathyarchaeota archaeon]
MNEETRTLKLLGVSNQQATHIRLVKGVVRVNPHLQVMCPRLASGENCMRGASSRRNRIPFRPRLLVKNHGDPRLQLWMCEGCKDKFLLRVKF